MTPKKREDAKRAQYIYGPVPSRRLGYSLGVDIIPYKICTFDCIYCQLGATTRKTIARREYVESKEILRQIEDALSSGATPDYITFSGSGEPTLNSRIGMLIQEIKNLTHTPIAVLTNSSLLFRTETRRDLLRADLLLPSLDAGRETTFQCVNRPHRSLHLRNILSGLMQLRKEYEGQIWLEVMLVSGVNDSDEELKRLVELMSAIEPDKVQLNTVVRPPTLESAQPLTSQRLEEIRALFGSRCEIIPQFKGEERQRSGGIAEQEILAIVRRRPVTLSDIVNSLGLHRNEVIKHLKTLERKGMITSRAYKGSRYYEVS